MILTCPVCATRYEVAPAALPEGGRAVECSNCGHGWFWRPDGPTNRAAVPGGARPGRDPGDVADDGDEAKATGEDAALSPPLEQRLPPAVLAVLREEAAREIAARAADAAGAPRDTPDRPDAPAPTDGPGAAERDARPAPSSGAGTPPPAARPGRTAGRSRPANIRPAIVLALLLVPVALALAHAFAGPIAAKVPALAPLLDLLRDGVEALRGAMHGAD